MRRNAREVSATRPDDEPDLDELYFANDGHFREMPQGCGNPEAAFGERQSFQALEACVQQLPNHLGRAFLMREWMGLETSGICKEIGITPTNLGVTLHRARLRLRDCLQLSWFANTR